MDSTTVVARRRQVNPHLARLGARLADHRRSAGLTQFDLGMEAGVHPKHVSEIERGRKNPRALTLKALADRLGVTVGELFDH